MHALKSSRKALGNLSSPEHIMSDDTSNFFLAGEYENVLPIKQFEYSPDFESCFDSDFLFDLANIKDNEVNIDEISNTGSCLDNNTSDMNDPSCKKQKRRDSLAIFQSMVDDGDLDFDNDEEQTASSNSELSPPKITDAPGESSKYNKDPAAGVRMNLSNPLKRRRSSVGNDLQSHRGNVETVYTGESIFVPPSILVNRNSTIELLITLQGSIQKSQQSHQLLIQWDTMMGLKKCDARTMLKSSKSRKKLLKLVTKTIKKVS